MWKGEWEFWTSGDAEVKLADTLWGATLVCVAIPLALVILCVLLPIMLFCEWRGYSLSWLDDDADYPMRKL